MRPLLASQSGSGDANELFNCCDKFMVSFVEVDNMESVGGSEMALTQRRVRIRPKPNHHKPDLDCGMFMKYEIRRSFESTA